MSSAKGPARQPAELEDAATPAQALSAEALLRARHGGARILVVDDNEINSQIAVHILHAAGLAAETAVDGQVAVDLVRAHSYDLILMDVQMPKLDGCEATRIIRTLPGWASKPIVAMTANAFVEDRRMCAAAGMTEFIAKPVRPALLYETILKCLDESRYESRP